MRQHTRMVFTPTGPAHLGHAFMASMNRRLALNTGGSFSYRFETEQARMSGVIEGVDLRVGRMMQAEDNYSDMCFLDLTPVNDPLYPVQWEENFEITKFEWKRLGCYRMFGRWPTPFYAGMGYNPDALCWKPGFHHPFITLSHVVEDLRAGVNCVIRGSEMDGEKYLYEFFAAQLVCCPESIPSLWGFPIVHRLVNHQKPRLSSSMPLETGNMRIRDLREAGRTAEEFWRWFDLRLFGESGWNMYWMCAEEVLRNIRQPILLVQEEWDKFLEDGEL